MDAGGLTLVIPAVVVIVGWVAAHRFNVRRDTLAKRRDLRVQYLLEAYRRLEAAANRDVAVAAEGKRAFESAVADIQLLGTRPQIEAVLEYLQKHAEQGGSNIDPVLELLRADLRSELNLEKQVPNVRVFRFRDDL